jgi:hypothetical protein
VTATDSTDELLNRACVLAADVLAPGAAAVDAGSVRRADLDALGTAGLLGAARAPVATFRAVQEVLAGADASTWFVQVQHHHLVRMLAGAPTQPLLDDLLAGRRVAGVAFSHLRRWPQRLVTATRVAGGWSFEGRVPWYTGWGLNDVMSLGGATQDGRVVFAVVDAVAGPSLRPTEPMRLAALGATQTVQLDLTDLFVADDQVLSVEPVEEWAGRDVRTTVNVNPAVLGIAQAAVERLAAIGAERGSAEASELASGVADRLARLRVEAYAAADDPSTEPGTALDLRVAAHRLCLDVTGAVVAAGAGASMRLADPAQRWAREATFLMVQAQTPDARAAMLRSWL